MELSGFVSSSVWLRPVLVMRGRQMTGDDLGCSLLAFPPALTVGICSVLLWAGWPRILALTGFPLLSLFPDCVITWRDFEILTNTVWKTFGGFFKLINHWFKLFWQRDNFTNFIKFSKMPASLFGSMCQFQAHSNKRSLTLAPERWCQAAAEASGSFPFHTTASFWLAGACAVLTCPQLLCALWLTDQNKMELKHACGSSRAQLLGPKSKRNLE